MGLDEKETMRELIMSGGPWSGDQRTAILDYCASDVKLLRPLIVAMAPELTVTPQRLGHAVWRGRYMGAVATMEHNGVPIDKNILDTINANWLDIQDGSLAGHQLQDGWRLTTIRSEIWPAPILRYPLCGN